MVKLKQVLILSFEDDAHAISISNRLKRHFSAEAILWDTSGVPGRQSLTFISHDDEVLLGGVMADPVQIKSVISCWWRRPLAAEIPDDVEDSRVRKYCQSESDRMIRGAILAAGCPLVNDPICQSAADHKPLQLKMAKEVGLIIPRTVITNDPDIASRFVDNEPGKCIFKAFHSPSWRVVETREFQNSMRESLSALRFAPAIFQEYVSLGRDIRVTAIGGQIFAFEVTQRSTEAYLDWRLDIGVQWSPIILPNTVQLQIDRLLKKLNLKYGCLDFRESPEGDYVFLEINPSGQFLFLEQEGKYIITDSFCELLLSISE